MSKIRFDSYELDRALEKLRETEERARITPRTWGGPLEELYETIIAKLNAGIDLGWGKKGSLKEKSIELERHYTGIQQALLREHPELKIWYKAHGVDN